MEILLLFIAGCVISVLLVLVAKEHERANTANERADKKLQEALLQAGERLKKVEASIRADAIKKSTAVVRGKVAEQLVPFGTNFGYNPRDARFLGSPIDLVVFEGLTEGNVIRIVFIEVKSGKYARLSQREKQVQRAIENAEVDYEILHAGGNQ